MKNLNQYIIEKLVLSKKLNKNHSYDFSQRLEIVSNIQEWLSEYIFPPANTRFKYKLDDKFYLVLSHIKSNNEAKIHIGVGTDDLIYSYSNYMLYTDHNDFKETLKKHILPDAKKYINLYYPFIYEINENSAMWKRNMRPYKYKDNDFDSCEIYEITDVIAV
jgi:hypothetical protein